MSDGEPRFYVRLEVRQGDGGELVAEPDLWISVDGTLTFEVPDGWYDHNVGEPGLSFPLTIRVAEVRAVERPEGEP